MATAELRGRVSVDTTDLNRAGRAVEVFDQKLHKAFKRDPGQRAENIVQDIVGNLATGNVGGAIVTATDKFNAFGLAGGAALGLVGAGLVYAVGQAKEFAEAMTEANNVLARMPAAGASIEQLGKHLEAISQQQEKIGRTSLIGQFLFREQQGDTAVRGDIAAQQKKVELSDQFARTLDRQVDKTRELAQITLLEASGHKSAAEAMKARVAIAEQLAAIEGKATEMRQKVGERRLALPQEAQELSAIDAWEAHQKEITRQTGERSAQLKQVLPLFERSRLTGKEISGGAGTLEDRLKMQQAERAAAMGEIFRKQGFIGLAAEQFRISEQWKAGIGGLKESEKSPEFAFKNAIDSAAVFQAMIAELIKISTGVGSISFKNQ